jgi:hypothetical protein
MHHGVTRFSGEGWDGIAFRAHLILRRGPTGRSSGQQLFEWVDSIPTEVVPVCFADRFDGIGTDEYNLVSIGGTEPPLVVPIEVASPFSTQAFCRHFAIQVSPVIEPRFMPVVDDEEVSHRH